ncbi:MAG TPA: response regulator transcription factor [Acidimicrobiales bacterium]|nr:response regulator transcription factor [Acidimicrobiales bacterium]
MTIRVAVVDDQALVRRGFAMILDRQEDIEVVAEAGNGLEAIEAARQHRPDVVLMDIRMPEMDGLAATAAIVEQANWPIKVIILTTFDPDEYVYRALQAGASGFVLKDIPPEQLAPAVRTVADGGALLDPTITRRLIGRFAQTLATDTATAKRLDTLTDREREVLTQLAAGANNSEISDALYIGAATVKSHVSNLLTKLGLRDRAQAVVFAYESGLITPGHQDIGH